MNENKIPSLALQKGPDLFYPGSRTQKTHGGIGLKTFIYTKYPDSKGNRYFEAPASKQHIAMITENPDILKALFGDKLKKVMPDITYTVDGKERIDPYNVRALTIEDNIFGRTGYYGSHSVVMFWNVSNWNMALEALKHLNAKDTDLVTVGDEEIGTVSSVKKKYTKKTTSAKKAVDVKANEKKQKALDLIRYHTATGAEKEALKQKLFSGDSGIQYPDVSKMSPEDIEKFPWKRQHWRMKAKELGISDPFDYGESKFNSKMKGFNEWLKQRYENDC